MPSQTPDFKTRIKSNFEAQQVMAFLGASLEHIEEGKCEIHLPFRPELSQQNGFFHAGIISTVVDSAAGYAALSVMPMDSDVLSVEYKMNLLRPGAGHLLIAKGEVIKPGRQLVVCKGEAWVQNKDEQKLCVTGLFTMITLSTLSR